MRPVLMLTALGALARRFSGAYLRGDLPMHSTDKAEENTSHELRAV